MSSLEGVKCRPEAGQAAGVGGSGEARPWWAKEGELLSGRCTQTSWEGVLVAQPQGKWMVATCEAEDSPVVLPSPGWPGKTLLLHLTSWAQPQALAELWDSGRVCACVYLHAHAQGEAGRGWLWCGAGWRGRASLWSWLDTGSQCLRRSAGGEREPRDLSIEEALGPFTGWHNSGPKNNPRLSAALQNFPGSFRHTDSLRSSIACKEVSPVFILPPGTLSSRENL